VSSAVHAEAPGTMMVFLRELAKIPAFVRRDLMVTLSYRGAFVMDLVNLATQAVRFWFIGKMVDPATLPTAESLARATWSSSRSAWC
jgi:hypothetical protein